MVVFTHDTKDTRVDFFENELWTRSSVNMDSGRTVTFHEVSAVKRNRHELRRVFCAFYIIIASVAFFEERRWGKWHEFGAAEALIEPLVHLGFGGAIQYGTIA